MNTKYSINIRFKLSIFGNKFVRQSEVDMKFDEKRGVFALSPN